MTDIRVLFLWNTAATFNPVADWLIDNGHDARIVMRTIWDLGDCTKDHRVGIMAESVIDYYREAIRQIRVFRPTHIHVSSTIKVLLLCRLLAPRTPIVFTYHGSEIRGCVAAHRETQLADIVTVTTPDLAMYGRWIDRPICSIFRDRGERIPNTALAMYNDNFLIDRRTLAREWCEERGIELTILDRTDPSQEAIPYFEMPQLYSRYEYYLDFKGFIGEDYALSKAAMEAFLCGCKVFHDSDLEEPLNEIQTGDVMEYINLYRSLDRSSMFTGLKRLLKTGAYALRNLLPKPL